MTDGPLRLIEPVPIDDDLCTALVMIEEVNGLARLVYCAEQTCYETSDTLLVVKRKVVLPFEAVDAGNRQVRTFLDDRKAGRLTLRLVK